MLTFYISGCTPSDKEVVVKQLTFSPKGHMLHHNRVFSPDSKWIVFDGRNDETKIRYTKEIGIINIDTGEEIIIYSPSNSSIYGPGVGAASFSPINNEVIFIHGLLNANDKAPYDISRRTGVLVQIEQPNIPIFIDARDVTFPYTPGSLRGGTHSHCWSADGQLISFTYNDEFVEPNLRTVGVMFDRGKEVIVDQYAGNNDGKWYAAIVANVTSNPKLGSDDIDKAFDECWVGNNGYVNADGKRIPYAIAFQGNTKNKEGETITEIYVTDIDISLILQDSLAVGSIGERPRVAKGLNIRRVTRSEKGLAPVRHWLRSSPNGQYIYALAEDDNNLVQIIQCDINTGQIDYLTNNTFSIEYPFNLNAEGTKLAFIGNNNVYLLSLDNLEIQQLTNNPYDGNKIIGAPSFSPDGNTLVFNQFQKEKDKTFLQIMYVRLR